MDYRLEVRDAKVVRLGVFGPCHVADFALLFDRLADLDLGSHVLVHIDLGNATLTGASFSGMGELDVAASRFARAFPHVTQIIVMHSKGNYGIARMLTDVAADRGYACRWFLDHGRGDLVEVYAVDPGRIDKTTALAGAGAVPPASIREVSGEDSAWHGRRVETGRSGWWKRVLAWGRSGSGETA